MNVGNNDAADEEDDIHDSVLDPVCPKVNDVREALQVLNDYMPFCENANEIKQKLHTLASAIDRSVAANMAQTDIRTFFQ